MCCVVAFDPQDTTTCIACRFACRLTSTSRLNRCPRAQAKSAFPNASGRINLENRLFCPWADGHAKPNTNRQSLDTLWSSSSTVIAPAPATALLDNRCTSTTIALPPRHHRRPAAATDSDTFDAAASPPPPVRTAALTVLLGCPTARQSLRCTARPRALVIGEVCDRRPSHQLPVSLPLAVRPVRPVQLTKPPAGRTVVGVPCTSTRYATPTQRPAAATTTHRRHALRCNLQELLVAPQPSTLLRPASAASSWRAHSIAYTFVDTPHSATPDAVVDRRIAHPTPPLALGHGYRQSCNCASHRWRAQTCDACPERGRPVEEGPGQLVEAVQEER